jgi:16S rRNA (guanine966-N2)-methyltransferase
MRITGGSLSGRVIKAPEGMGTRPTTDRVREALFNILAHHDFGRDILEEAVVLDAFCGTGALAFESLSWGAAKAFLFDQDRQAMKMAKANAEGLGVTDRCSFFPSDVTRAPKAPEACNLIFLDPPYRKNLIPPTLAALQKKGWIAPRALIVAETAKKEEVLWPEEFEPLLSRSYGDTAVWFVKCRE